jgi:hypothetical protein
MDGGREAGREGGREGGIGNEGGANQRGVGGWERPEKVRWGGGGGRRKRERSGRGKDPTLSWRPTIEAKET